MLGMTLGTGFNTSRVADLDAGEELNSSAMRPLGKLKNLERRRSLARFGCGVAALLLGFGSAEIHANPKLDVPMVLTQVPRKGRLPPPTWDPNGLVRSDWFEGSRLVLVLPGKQVQVLSKGFQSACDANVSFDGRRLLFAGKKDRNSRWRIWEVGLDGQGLRPVSPENLEARSPIYVSTLFTLDSPEPWFTTVFVGREQTVNEVGRASASSLYNIKLDGTELRRLTYNPNHKFDPHQMWDGRVIYSAERYPNQPGGGEGHVGIYAIHVEGADMELHGGELGGRIQQMPCATAGGLVIFVESSRATWDGAGQLACVQERRPHATYQRLTEDASQVFLYPSSWRDNVVLVSRRAADGKDPWAVFCFNADTRQCEPVFASPGYHNVQARVVQPRNRPDGHSTVVNPKFNTGIFYGLNCNTADEMREAHLKPGCVKRVRFIEGVLQPTTAAGWPFVPRRLIGEAPVEPDGSFNVEVPADTPILSPH